VFANLAINSDLLHADRWQLAWSFAFTQTDEINATVDLMASARRQGATRSLWGAADEFARHHVPLSRNLNRFRGHTENRPISAAAVGTENSSVFRHMLRVPKTHTLSRSRAPRDDR
jgi:hypothetical protein